MKPEKFEARRWARGVRLGALLAGTALVGVVVAQTSPGTASPGHPFEVHGLLYSGSAPAGFPLGDGWAQGTSFYGVLDDDGLAALDANGYPFRAARTIDPNWGNSGDGYDPTLFSGSNKNSDLIGAANSPWSWDGGGGSPQKNDITNAYFHTRVDPFTGDRWVFVAAETRSINGDSHVDFEFNQAGVLQVGGSSGQLVGLGPDGGRTVNDVLITVDFQNGGEHPVASVRTWTGTEFVLVDLTGAVFSATNLVDIPHGAGGVWKHFTEDGAEVDVLTRLQFVEGAANLTALGIDLDPCNPEATFMVKTRSSSSWTAELKDFAIVNFPLEPMPELTLNAPTGVCLSDTFSVVAKEVMGLPNTTISWAVSGCGRIVGAAEGNIVNVAADPICNCEMTVSATVVGGECAHTIVESTTVRVGDDVRPTLDAEPADSSVECDAIPEAPTITAQDDCADVAVTYAEESIAGECVGDATLLREWRTTDECGNEASHVQVVAVSDTKAPTLQGVPADETVACDAIPEAAVVSAGDNCSDAVVEYAEQITAGSCVGEARLDRTWTATDACGNQFAQTQVVTVVDEAPPVLSGVPAGDTVECDSVPEAAVVSATDNCSPAPVQFGESTTPGACQGEGVLTRTWSAADDCGNTATQDQLIVLVDTTPPRLIGVPVDVVAECDAVPAPAIVTASDNCSDPTVDFEETLTAGSGAGKATIMRTWTATDACGNSASATQIITVVDTTAPIFDSTPPDLTAECDAVPVPAAVTAVDNCAVPAVSFTESIEPGDCTGRSTVVRTWVATDDCGNSTTYTQRITVVDTTPPLLADTPADATVECDNVPEPAHVTASDHCSTAPVELSEVSEPGTCVGSSTITRTWTATDTCGNASSYVQILDVIDSTPPELSDQPEDLVAECDAVPPPPTLTASDQCDPEVPVDRTDTTTPGSCPGEYTVLRDWSSVDDCGNENGVDQLVTVQDTKGPKISLAPRDTMYICDGRPVAFTLSATDNCTEALLSIDDVITITANNRDRVTITELPDGTIRITATGAAFISGSASADDECGNVSAPFELRLSARIGREACSQGFWKNHADRWPPTGLSPSMRFVDAFEIVDLSSGEIPADFDENMTLFEAANSTGGSFDQTLLQGSAALLNAAHPSVDYPFTVAQVQEVMQAAFAGVITFSEATAFFNLGNAAERECGCSIQ